MFYQKKKFEDAGQSPFSRLLEQLESSLVYVSTCKICKFRNQDETERKKKKRAVKIKETKSDITETVLGCINIGPNFVCLGFSQQNVTYVVLKRLYVLRMCCFKFCFILLARFFFFLLYVQLCLFHIC